MTFGRLLPVLLLLALLGAGAMMLYNSGRHAEELERLKAQQAAEELIYQQELERLQQESETLQLYERLTNEASDSPTSTQPSLGVGSVQRLNQLR